MFALFLFCRTLFWRSPIVLVPIHVPVPCCYHYHPCCCSFGPPQFHVRPGVSAGGRKRLKEDNLSMPQKPQAGIHGASAAFVSKSVPRLRTHTHTQTHARTHARHAQHAQHTQHAQHGRTHAQQAQHAQHARMHMFTLGTHAHYTHMHSSYHRSLN